MKNINEYERYMKEVAPLGEITSLNKLYKSKEGKIINDYFKGKLNVSYKEYLKAIESQCESINEAESYKLDTFTQDILTKTKEVFINLKNTALNLSVI